MVSLRQHALIGCALFAALLTWVGAYFLGFGTIAPFPEPVALLMAVLVYPVLEEFVFRGGIQHWLRRYHHFKNESINGVTYANLATSSLFALTHVFSHGDWWYLSVFLPSLLLGAIYDQQQKISHCIVVHGFFNLGFVVLGL